MSNTEIRNVENNFGNPKLSPPEIMARVLKLIDHAHTREDLSEESVQNVLGLYMHPNNQSSDRTIIFSQIISSEWRWSVKNYALEEHRIFDFDFVHPDMITEMTTVCQMDLDQFHNSLLQMGYQHISSVRSSFSGRQYQRGDVNIDVSYVGEKNELVMHHCVKAVTVEI